MINLEVCDSTSTLSHRIGRGGRFGKRAQCLFISGTKKEIQLIEEFGKEMKIKIQEFTQMPKLIKNINEKLKSSKLISEQEKEIVQREKEITQNTENSENIGENMLKSLVDNNSTESSDFEDVRILPRIPPIWETLRLPPPVSAEKEPIGNDIDEMTDEEFKIWRQTKKPREETHFDDLGFSSKVLKTSKYWENEKESSEESESEKSFENNSESFLDLYNTLYDHWRALYS